MGSKESLIVIEMSWNSRKPKVKITWCGVLKGKDLIFITITTTDIEIHAYSFRRILTKLEARFGVKELTETSKAKFRLAYQKPEESVED